MDGAEFIRRTRRYASRSGLRFRYVPRRGKGSHGALYVGENRTIVKQGRIAPGLFHAMLKQLGFAKEDF